MVHVMSEVKSFKLVSSVLIDRILKDQCVSTAQLDQLSKASSPDFLHFVCTALPGPASECVFVELETPDGNGLGLGEWITRPDGLVALVVPTSRYLDAQRLRADTAEAELADLRQQHAEQTCVFCNNSGELLSVVKTERLRGDAAVGDANEAERKLAAAEQRIASHEKLLRRIAKHYDGSDVRELHRAIDEIDAALNPNPEAESHE